MSENKEFKTLTIWDREYKTLLTKKFEGRKPYKAADPFIMESFIPGTVRDIMVKEGQTVKKGDPVLILESMKMLNIVRSGVNGKVKSIKVAKDEAIPKNHVMVEFE